MDVIIKKLQKGRHRYTVTVSSVKVE